MRRLVRLLVIVLGCVLAAPAVATGSAPTAGFEAAGSEAAGSEAAGSEAAGSTVTAPPANGRFDYQIGGAYAPLASVAVVDRDRTSKPVAGRYNICYINAFQTQAEMDPWWKRHHSHLLLRNAKGQLVEDPGWPGEILLDTATAKDRRALATVESRWLAGCRSKGFQAVEPDNLDSNTRSHHLLTQADDFTFAGLLIKRAHADGLAIAQKNSAEQSAAGHRLGFNFAIAEECQVYNECGDYTRAYGDEVIEIEYTDNPRSDYTKACAARGDRISVILRDRDVVARGRKAYRYQAC
jgi:Glycoside-hydrolase family GH114